MWGFATNPRESSHLLIPVKGLGFTAYDFGFRVRGLRFGDWGLGPCTHVLGRKSSDTDTEVPTLPFCQMRTSSFETTSNVTLMTISCSVNYGKLQKEKHEFLALS